ncbi:hypothetical protein H4Q26_017481 [Puccinia striiformis f. sp. tritici PST-130]|nr:hypothetical protein H4Q26_017481 [Puccinia striiformis f. sp. tritici PST-130]
MLRFPTSIPLRTAEFNEFKESILSAQKNSQAAQAPTQSSATQQSSGDQAFERNNQPVRAPSTKKQEEHGLPSVPSLSSIGVASMDGRANAYVPSGTLHPYFQINHPKSTRLCRMIAIPICIYLALATIERRSFLPLDKYIHFNFGFVTMPTFHLICLSFIFGFHQGPVFKSEVELFNQNAQDQAEGRDEHHGADQQTEKGAHHPKPLASHSSNQSRNRKSKSKSSRGKKCNDTTEEKQKGSSPADQTSITKNDPTKTSVDKTPPIGELARWVAALFMNPRGLICVWAPPENVNGGNALLVSIRFALGVEVVVNSNGDFDHFLFERIGLPPLRIIKLVSDRRMKDSQLKESRGAYSGFALAGGLFNILEISIISLLRVILPKNNSLRPDPLNPYNYPPLFNTPWLRTSLTEFGVKAVFRHHFLFCGAQPMYKIFHIFGPTIGKLAAVMGAMGLSAAMHEFCLVAVSEIDPTFSSSRMFLRLINSTRKHKKTLSNWPPEFLDRWVGYGLLLLSFSMEDPWSMLKSQQQELTQTQRKEFINTPRRTTEKAKSPDEMAKRKKNRTHKKGKEAATAAAATSTKSPKSFIIKSTRAHHTSASATRSPHHSTSLNLLVKDFRKVMEPNTASHLRGPTLTFKILRFSLMIDILNADKHARSPGAEFKTEPLLVQTRRVVLLSYNPTTRTIDFRHFLITVKPIGEGGPGSTASSSGFTGDRSENTEDGNQSDYDGLSSEGEDESEGEEAEDRRVQLPQNYLGRGNIKNTKKAIRLKEIGPRMELGLIKIEQGLAVEMYYIMNSSKGEDQKIKKKIKEKETLKSKRKKEQEENVKKKAMEKEAKKKPDKKAPKQADDQSAGQEGEANEEEADNDDDRRGGGGGKRNR